MLHSFQRWLYDEKHDNLHLVSTGVDERDSKGNCIRYVTLLFPSLLQNTIRKELLYEFGISIPQNQPSKVRYYQKCNRLGEYESMPNSRPLCSHDGFCAIYTLVGGEKFYARDRTLRLHKSCRKLLAKRTWGALAFIQSLSECHLQHPSAIMLFQLKVCIKID